MTWTVLPQGFRDSSHLFGQVLSWDLLDLDLGPNGKILQYVDDLLICSPDEENAQQHAIQVLNFVAERGHKVSCAKAQVVQTKVTYLGFQIIHRSRRLFSGQYKESSSCLPLWLGNICVFLGLTSYCRLWIPNYGQITQPLYKNLKWQDDSIPLTWGPPQKKAEATQNRPYPKHRLMLPDPEKAQIYVHSPTVCPQKGRNSLGSVNSKVGTWAPANSLLMQEAWIQSPEAGLPVFEILQLLQS